MIMNHAVFEGRSLHGSLTLLAWYDDHRSRCMPRPFWTAARLRASLMTGATPTIIEGEGAVHFGGAGVACCIKPV
jgi:hypothetical protein